MRIKALLIVPMVDFEQKKSGILIADFFQHETRGNTQPD